MTETTITTSRSFQTSTFLLALPLCLVFSHAGLAQQVDCAVRVDYEGVSTTNKDLLSDFEANLRDYMNNYPWGTDEVRVSCAIQVSVRSVIGDNRYSAQVAVVSQRERMGSHQNTAVVRLFDESWEFTYVQNRPLNHNPSVFNDLTSVLDFYAYTILGYDYDSYESLGGTRWFQKAADIANLARSSGQKGWQNVTGSYSRTQLIDEILNPNLSSIRIASYTYHFAGLDSLNVNRNRAYERIIESLESIGEIRSSVDPRNLVIRAFFDAKSLEIADIFLEYPDPSIYLKLSAIDPTHQTTYEERRARRQ